MSYHWKEFVCFLKRTSNPSDPFALISNMFLVFGIHFCHIKLSKTKERVIWFVQKFTIFCWGLVILVSASYFKYTLKHVDTKSYIIKLRLVRILEVTDSFFIFYSVYRSRKKISRSVREMTNLGRSFHLKPSKFAAISALMVAFSHSFICFSILYPYDVKRYRYTFDQFTFEMIPLSDQMIFCVLLVLFNILVGLVEIFPFCFVLFYGTLCKYLQEILTVYLKGLEISSRKVINCYNVDDCFRQYNSIVEVLHHFEGAVSFSIFLVFSINFSGILFGILVLVGGCQISYLPPLGTASIATLYFGSFVLMSYLASEVNECDKRTKRVHRELLKHLLLSGIPLRSDEKFSFLIINSDPPFALTAWGFFQITKSFLLGAIGCIFTYAFFIANL